MLRIVFLPMVAFLTTMLLDLSSLERSTLILIHGMPVAISMIILSERYNFLRDRCLSYSNLLTWRRVVSESMAFVARALLEMFIGIKRKPRALITPRLSPHISSKSCSKCLYNQLRLMSSQLSSAIAISSSTQHSLQM
jgi:hypothetical protein